MMQDRAEKTDNDRVSVGDAAQMLGCSSSYIYVLLADGRLQGYRVGRRKGLWVWRASVTDFLRARCDEA